ncbi:MAG TPA: hypothetical protein DCS93_16975 [Microscillaceae bacterium]|nr:hypothetical protein [Microscillaceae bacterium]
MRTILWSILFFILTGTQQITLAQKATLNTKTLNNYLEKYLPQFKIPGFALAVVQNGEVIYQKYHGKVKLKGNAQINDQSLFQIASCTKAFTAAALGILVQQGKLKWDDKVIQYLPNFKLSDEWITQHLTIRDLLSHRSGLATYDGDLLIFRRAYRTEDVLNKIKHYPIRKPFRASYGYQNIMYMVAGEVVKQVSGKPWEVFVKEHIFAPLQMNHSYTHSPVASNPNLVQPFILQKPIDFVKEQPNASGSIFSTMSDMIRWTKMWLNPQNKLLKPSTIHQIFKPHNIRSISNLYKQLGIQFHHYGLGWQMFGYAGKKVVEHGGFLPGYMSKVMLIPEENLGVVMLSNDIHTFREALFFNILGNLLTNKPIDIAPPLLKYQQQMSKSSEYFIQAQRKRRKVNTSPSLPVEKFTGIYEDKLYGKAEVTLQGKKLYLKLLPHTQVFCSELSHWQDNQFLLTFKMGNYGLAGFVNFQTNKNGKLTGFKLNIPNPDLNFYNLNFEKK